MENLTSPDLYSREYIQSLLNKRKLTETELKAVYSSEEGMAALKEKETRGDPLTDLEETILQGTPVDIAWLNKKDREGRVFRGSDEDILLDRYFQGQGNDFGRQMRELMYPEFSF